MKPGEMTARLDQYADSLVRKSHFEGTEADAGKMQEAQKASDDALAELRSRAEPKTPEDAIADLHQQVEELAIKVAQLDARRNIA